MLSFGMLGGLSVCPAPMMASVTQQTIKVSGQVVDQDGEPLIGATVKVQGAQSGAITSRQDIFYPYQKLYQWSE